MEYKRIQKLQNGWIVGWLPRQIYKNLSVDTGELGGYKNIGRGTIRIGLGSEGKLFCPDHPAGVLTKKSDEMNQRILYCSVPSRRLRVVIE